MKNDYVVDVTKGTVKVMYRSGRSREYSVTNLPASVKNDMDDYTKTLVEVVVEQKMKACFEKAKEIVKAKAENYSSEFFKSLDAEVIFYLTMAGGEERVNRLGINVMLYSDTAAANKWLWVMRMIVENSDNPYKDLAIRNLKQMRVEADWEENGRMLKEFSGAVETVETAETEVTGLERDDEPVYEDFNPVTVWRGLDSVGNEAYCREQMTNILNSFPEDALRMIVKENQMDFGGNTRSMNKDKLVAYIIEMTADRAYAGNAFRDVK